jgi:hypothetical protein
MGRFCGHVVFGLFVPPVTRGTHARAVPNGSPRSLGASRRRVRIIRRLSTGASAGVGGARWVRVVPARTLSVSPDRKKGPTSIRRSGRPVSTSATTPLSRHRLGDQGTSPTWSATYAPRAPRGFSGPVVVSLRVWCSISALSSAPSSTTNAETQSHISKAMTAPSEP